VDYTASSSATIPAGATKVDLTIIPLPLTNIVGDKTVILNLSNSSSYSLGTPPSATVTIAGNSVAIGSVAMTRTGLRMTWPSSSGAIYRVSYKNNLTDPTWIPVTATVTATGSS